MKEATGELNMTLVTIIAIAAILTFVVAFLPGLLGGISSKWNDAEGMQKCYNADGQEVACTNTNQQE